MAKTIVLFSGGLDSILAAKLMERQNIETLCLHFTSPFFGSAAKIAHWKRQYNLNIISKDISAKFVEMLSSYPAHGFGKNLNPCVDCKILIFSEAKRLLRELGADFLCSGEVIGQRPMSQRRDTLNLIQNWADVTGLLLRPLCAQHLPPTRAEESGIVDRSKLLGISGRGRNPQLDLAKEFGLTEIPSPAGGCRLTEKENARRYWQLLKKASSRKLPELVKDFHIISHGRALFHMKSGNWLIMGRNKANNNIIASLATETDLLLRLKDVPGPLALIRDGAFWPEELMRQAAEILASYAPAAIKNSAPAIVIARGGNFSKIFAVRPNRHEAEWFVPDWQQTHLELKQLRKDNLASRAKNKGLPPETGMKP